MTRRHWFLNLLAALAGAWGAARAVPRPRSRTPAPGRRLALAWPTDAVGTSTCYAYDGANRLVAVRDELCTVTIYTYDGPG